MTQIQKNGTSTCWNTSDVSNSMDRGWKLAFVNTQGMNKIYTITRNAKWKMELIR